MCKHDPLYRINNESACGAGCPLCAAERRKAAPQPDYGPASHAATVAARYADPHQHEPNQVCLADMMLATGRMDYPEWMSKIWPTLPEIEY